MQLSSHPPLSRSTPHRRVTLSGSRRIPRGRSQHADPISLLEHRARQGKAHIRSMESRIKGKQHRETLREYRRQLVKLLTVISQTPWEVTTGTSELVETTVAKACKLYVQHAPKKLQMTHPRRPKRPAEGEVVRAKNRLDRYNDTDPDEEPGPKTDPRPMSVQLGIADRKGRDAVANDFAAQIDAEEAAGRAAAGPAVGA